MAMPVGSKVQAIGSQEQDYGSGSSVGALIERQPISNRKLHPVEESELSFRQRQEEKEDMMAQKAFGLGFVMHQRHQRAVMSLDTTGHIGFPSSHALRDAWTGRDRELDFTDTLAQDLEPLRTPHMAFESIPKLNI